MLKRLSTYLRLTPPRDGSAKKNGKAEKKEVTERVDTPVTEQVKQSPKTETPAMAPSAMPPAVNGINGVAASYEYPPANPEGEYKVLNQYHSKPSKLRVACCGAGASGLCLAYKMERLRPSLSPQMKAATAPRAQPMS